MYVVIRQIQVLLYQGVAVGHMEEYEHLFYNSGGTLRWGYRNVKASFMYEKKKEQIFEKGEVHS